MQLFLGLDQGSVIEVRAGEEVEIGRACLAARGIPQDPHMSARHFAVVYHGGQCRIRDLDSTNGTFVNGARVSEATLKDGDRIEVGESTFVVRLRHDEPPELATASPAPSIPAPAKEAPTGRAPAAIPLVHIANDTPFPVATLRWPDVDNKPR